MIDGQDHIGRLRRGGGPAGPHSDPDVGQGQGGRVVDSVAGHNDGGPLLFPAYRVQLGLWRQLREHLIDPGERPDSAGCFGTVAGHQDDPRNATAAQRPDRLPGVRPDPVLEQSAPAGLPSIATNTVRAPSSQARLRTA